MIFTAFVKSFDIPQKIQKKIMLVLNLVNLQRMDWLNKTSQTQKQKRTKTSN